MTAFRWPCAGGDGWVATPRTSQIVDDRAYCVTCEMWQPVWFDTVSLVFRWRAHSVDIEESVEVRAVRDAALLAVAPVGVREALDRLHAGAA